MLKYLTRLHLVGIGQAFPDSSNHFAHEQIVFQAPRRPSGGFADFSEIAVHTCLCLKLVGRRRCGALPADRMYLTSQRAWGLSILRTLRRGTRQSHYGPRLNIINGDLKSRETGFDFQCGRPCGLGCFE